MGFGQEQYLPGLEQPSTVRVATLEPGRTDALLRSGVAAVVEDQARLNVPSHKEKLFFGPNVLISAALIDGTMTLFSQAEAGLDYARSLHRDGQLKAVVSVAMPDAGYSELGTMMVIGQPFKENTYVRLAETNPLFQLGVANLEIALLQLMRQAHHDPTLVFSTGQWAEKTWSRDHTSTQTVDLLIRSFGVWETPDIQPRITNLGHDEKFEIERQLAEQFGFDYQKLAEVMNAVSNDPLSIRRVVEPLGIQIHLGLDPARLAVHRLAQAQRFREYILGWEENNASTLAVHIASQHQASNIAMEMIRTRPIQPNWGELLVLTDEGLTQMTKFSLFYGMGMIEASRVDLERHNTRFTPRFSDEGRIAYFNNLKSGLLQQMTRIGWQYLE